MIGPLARPLAQSASNSLLAGAGGGSSASLDIRASVGTSTSPAVSGDSPVTGIGFTPKCVIPFYGYQSAVGATTEAILSIGTATASAQAAISATSVAAMSTSSTHRRHTAAKVLTDSWGGSANIEASRTSLDADGFTFNWNIGISRLFNHICLGGADLEVSLVQCQMNGTNAAQSFAHGLSGAPTGVLAFGIQIHTTPPATIATNRLSIGAWAGSNQFCAGVNSATSATTTSTTRILANNIVAIECGTSVNRSMAVSSVDGTNVNVTYPNTGITFQLYLWMLCIRGAKCQVGTFNCNGSTSPLTITTTGITPKLFLPVSVQGGVPGNIGSVLSGLLLSIGASDGTNNVSCGITDANGVTTTNARRFQSSSSLVEYYTNGSKGFEATAAFSGESVVVTPTKADFNFGAGGYLILGS